jgi:hypothetical protein
MKQVLLVGNGINNIASEYKWQDLIADLVRFVNATRYIHPANKPFPLLYEEIVAYAVKRCQMPESDIKKFIAHKIAQFRPNEIHQHIIALGCEHILTTNYDYTLEMACGIPEHRTPVNCGVVKETRYSLFRALQTAHGKIWHIHGERKNPNSIALGYEHYSGYLQLMRNYVVMGTELAYQKKFDSLEHRLRKHTVQDDSWLDFFFTRDIFIVGLSLDFIELHLWWLLTYWGRRKYARGEPIRNRITYFYPASFAKPARAKLDLLRASDVTVRPLTLRGNDWNGYYHRVLDAVEKAK